MKSLLLKSIFALSVTILSIVVVSAQQKIQEEKALSSFSALDVRGPFSVELVASDKPMIQIDMDEKYKGLVQFSVNDEVLSVKWNGMTKTIPDDIKIKIQVSELTSITFNTTGLVSCSNVLKAKTMNVLVMETSRVSLLLDAERIDLTAKGTGAITLSGKTNIFSLFNYGKGDINAATLQSKAANMMSSGDGNTFIHASAQLGITATGSGTIKYYGMPGKVKISNAKGATIVNGQKS